MLTVLRKFKYYPKSVGLANFGKHTGFFLVGNSKQHQRSGILCIPILLGSWPYLSPIFSIIFARLWMIIHGTNIGFSFTVEMRSQWLSKQLPENKSLEWAQNDISLIQSDLAKEYLSLKYDFGGMKVIIKCYKSHFHCYTSLNRIRLQNALIEPFWKLVELFWFNMTFLIDFGRFKFMSCMLEIGKRTIPLEPLHICDPLQNKRL